MTPFHLLILLSHGLNKILSFVNLSPVKESTGVSLLL
jgi:hypothetical protein